jgi:putative DNA methylase
MTTVLRKLSADVLPPRAIEMGFPMVPLSRLAEKESWRKELGRPLYHIHKWWATRLGSVFRAINLAALAEHPADTWASFYQKHDLSNKVVLDPFMGSGTTLGEALKLGCSVVGCDINPISTFLVRQALTPVSEARLRAAYAEVEGAVRDEIRRYYTTADRETGEPITVLYGFWVKVLTTPAGEELPLFSSRIFARDAYPKKRPKAQVVCPKCWEIFEDRYDSLAVTCPTCRVSFNPQVGPASGQYLTDSANVRHKIKTLVPSDGSPPQERLFALMALRADGKKVYLKPTEEDHQLYREASVRLETENLPLPTAEVRPGHNTNQARGYNFTRWSDFFNDRQKLCLGLLLRAILRLEDRAAQEQLLCLFSSTLEFNNRFCSFKGEGTGAVRHMFSHHILKPERIPLENSVWGGKRTSGTFASLFESRLLPAKRYLDEPFEVGGQGGLFDEGGPGTGRTVASAPMRPILVEAMTRDHPAQAALSLNGDSSKLPLADRSIDAVVTDPPYFDFIHYSELSDFFYAWLGPVLSERYHYFNRDNSSGIGEVQHKDAPTFARLLGRVFAESARVLKDEGVLAFSFHHSRAEGWSAIYDALNQAGLAVVASHPIHAELRGSSPKSGAADPISLDAILVCRKRSSIGSMPASDEEVLARVKAKAGELRGAGLYISRTDEFVISAGEVLAACQGGASVDEVEARLERLRLILTRPEA